MAIAPTPQPMRAANIVAAWISMCALSACGSFSHTNRALETLSTTQSTTAFQPAAAPTRATFSIDGERGNPKVLMFLALSGGGSRAAHLSAAAMLRLQTLFDDVDLLNEVDAMSSVSGGSITAALYAATRDTHVTSAQLASQLPAVIAGTPLATRIQVDATTRHVRCSGPLTASERDGLRHRLKTSPAELRQLDALCRQATLNHLRAWDSRSVLELTQRNYLMRWFGNWLWPLNMARYWFTAYDRGDIMAQTLADNLYGTRLVGADLSMGELNPTRPYLFINATTATDQDAPGINARDEYAFGSVFTFTEQDFRDRINSDIGRYSLARAVMASSAFPLVFPNQTLQDHRLGALQTYCQNDRHGDLQCTDKQYLHVFDGGNSDNLGLKSIKRALLHMQAEGRLTHDRIIVVLIDAFTQPRGASRLHADPRGPLGLLLDMNVSDAVDSLLQHNRGRLLEEFKSAGLRWDGRDCNADTRELPSALCDSLKESTPPVLDLTQRLVFYHFSFSDVKAKNAPLKRKLDAIPTSFKLTEDDAQLIEEAVQTVIEPGNPCLQALRSLSLADEANASSIAAARAACAQADQP